jgi:hypothetical protein
MWMTSVADAIRLFQCSTWCRMLVICANAPACRRAISASIELAGAPLCDSPAGTRSQSGSTRVRSATRARPTSKSSSTCTCRRVSTSETRARSVISSCQHRSINEGCVGRLRRTCSMSSSDSRIVDIVRRSSFRCASAQNASSAHHRRERWTFPKSLARTKVAEALLQRGQRAQRHGRLVVPIG